MNGCDGVAVDGNGRVYVSLAQAGQVMLVLPPGDPGPLPSIRTDGVYSATAFGAFSSISPGSWIEIYGANLATGSSQWSDADFTGGQAPTLLAGTSVSIAGRPAFISYVSPGQINALVPGTVPLGSQAITVTTAVGTSQPYSITVGATQPGLYAPGSFVTGGKQYLGALFSDWSAFVLPANAIPGVTSRPARGGETIVLYGVGFGTVTPHENVGTITPELNGLDLPLQLFVNQARASVTYAGLAPGTLGLYQFNVVVPSGVAGDALPVTFTLGGVPGTQVVYIAVQQ
jgi:uncharacterized protein (TIGR03437 family)